jgi:hypothetical protein
MTTPEPCSCSQALSLVAEVAALRIRIEGLEGEREADDAATVARLQEAIEAVRRARAERDAALSEVAALKEERARSPSEALWTDYLRRVTVAEAELAALRGALEAMTVDRDAAELARADLWAGIADTRDNVKSIGAVIRSIERSGPWDDVAAAILAHLRSRSSLPVPSQGRGG